MTQQTTLQMNDPHMQMMYRQHLNKLWVHFGVIALGCPPLNVKIMHHGLAIDTP